jgi:hypothetical protein
MLKFISVSAILLAIGAAAGLHAQERPAANGRGDAALAHAAVTNKTLCLIFYREWDAPTQGVAQLVKSHSDRHSDRAIWNAAQVTDPAEKAVVDRFQLSRAPMPMVVAVHPNGAVTGFFSGKVVEAELARTLVSPVKASCMKLLQEDKLVLLCVKTAPEQPLPRAVVDFQADAKLGAKTKILQAQAGDANEAAFYSELKVAPGQPTTVFLAPPGVLVGRFTPSATMKDLATALHAAGKCCEDKNCKHNH